EHPVLLHELQRERRQVPAGRSIPRRLHAQDLVERPHAERETALLAFRVVGLGALVQIAVVPDLVAGGLDHARPLGVLLGHPARDEERRRHLLDADEVEQARHADVGAIAPLRDHTWSVLVRRVAREPPALGVEVEGEHHGDARAVGPGRGHAPASRFKVGVRASYPNRWALATAGADMARRWLRTW